MSLETYHVAGITSFTYVIGIAFSSVIVYHSNVDQRDVRQAAVVLLVGMIAFFCAAVSIGIRLFLKHKRNQNLPVVVLGDEGELQVDPTAIARSLSN